VAWIGDDVALLGRVLAGFPNLLHHPHMQDPLQCQQQACKVVVVSWAERLLNDILLLADVHGYFCDVLLTETCAALHHHAPCYPLLEPLLTACWLYACLSASPGRTKTNQASSKHGATSQASGQEKANNRSTQSK
jgi:hypothetical protein